MKTLKCEKCGYYAEVAFLSSENCPICQAKLIIEDIEEDNKLPDELEGLGDNYPTFNKEVEERTEKSQVEQMEDNIKNFGNDRTWELIEQMDLFGLRVQLRNWFFLAGGLAPCKELEIK